MSDLRDALGSALIYVQPKSMAAMATDEAKLPASLS